MDPRVVLGSPASEVAVWQQVVLAAEEQRSEWSKADGAHTANAVWSAVKR